MLLLPVSNVQLLFCIHNILLDTISSDETISLISDITNTSIMTASHSIEEPTSGILSEYILVYSNYIVLLILHY